MSKTSKAVAEYQKRNNKNEPKLAIAASASDLSNAYSWYNQYRGHDQFKQYFLDWAKRNRPNDLDILSRANKKEFRTIGPLVRFVENGYILTQANIDYINDKASEILTKYKDVVVEEEETPSVKDSVQDHVNEKAQNIIGMVEEMIDEVVESSFKKEFSMESFIAKHEIKPLFLTRIATYYAKLKTELEIAINKSDSQVVEAYSIYSAKQLNKFLDLIISIIRQCESSAVKAKAGRKPRKKKEYTPTQLTRGMKYLDKHEAYTSIDPTKIIGKSTLVTYCPRNKMFAIYYADSAHGLSVKGSTILNYKKSTSLQMKLKKPEELNGFLVNGQFDVGIRSLTNFIKAQKTKTYPLNGRINNKTLLLFTIR